MMPRWARMVVVAAAVVTCSVDSATAQERPFTVLAAGTITAPLSGTADNFNPGFGATAGVMWNLGEQYGVRIDGTWSTLTPKAVPASVGSSLDVGARVQSMTATFVFQAPPGRGRLYVLGGLGAYRRSVTLSGGSGTVNVCNPWWFACEPTPVPANRIAGTRSTTNIGVNVGFGVAVGRVFGELRFHYATGPTFDTPQGPQLASGKFLPLTVGVRF